MLDKLIDLDDILAVIRDRGPLSSRALARTLGLHDLDARLALLHTGILGLTERDDRGKWELTGKGRASLVSEARAVTRAAAPGTPLLARCQRGGALLLACLLVVAGVAIMASAGPGRAARRHRPAATHRALSREPGRSPRRPQASARGALVHRQNAAIDRLLARQPFIRSGGTERREVALTFDDGPGPYTPAILTELQRLHAPATFFTVGFMYTWFGASVARELTMGDVVGDHTETHPMLAQLPLADQERQILFQTEWLGREGGAFPRLLRPPYGSYDSATLAILGRLHMLMVLWSIDTQDYLHPGVAAIVYRAVSAAAPGAIILMHDAGGNRAQTIAALPLIVGALRGRGYKLVTVPELILQDPPNHRDALPKAVAGD
jgi:peptidoglycan/xylan/chitin deacetylase (PgdA/CDA1 family)